MIMRAGYLADRMSINLELPTAEEMKKLAPNKSHQTILKPMAKVTDTIAANRLAQILVQHPESAGSAHKMQY